MTTSVKPSDDAVCPVYADVISRLYFGGRISHSDNCWKRILTGDERAVCQSTADFGDDRRRVQK